MCSSNSNDLIIIATEKAADKIFGIIPNHWQNPEI